MRNVAGDPGEQHKAEADSAEDAASTSTSEKPPSEAFDALARVAEALAKHVTTELFASLLILDVIFAVVACVSLWRNQWWGLLALVFFGLITVVVLLRVDGNRRLREAIRFPSTVTKVMTATAELAALLTDEERADTQGLLGAAALEVAEALAVPPGHVRANVFGRLRSGRLGILPGLTYNMGNPPEELTLEIRLGYGSTGLCFSQVEPHLATFESGWAGDVLDDAGMAKLHPELRWIVSIPISTGNPPQTVWVMNVDGIGDVRTREQLRDIPSRLVNYGQALAVLAAELLRRHV